MKSVLFLFLLSGSIACNTASTVVYLCDSTAARRYHYRQDCRGLKNCGYQVREATIDEAREKGKTLCGWEK